MQRRAFLALLPAAGQVRGAGNWQAGCQTRAFGSPLPKREQFLAALDDIAATGFEGIETNFASLEHSFDDPGPMKDEFRRRRLELIGLHASPRLAQADVAEAEMRKGERIARGVRALGGSLFVMSGSGIPRGADGKMRADVMELWCRNLNVFGRYCREQGVRLCVHNHAKEVAHNAEELIGVMAGTDRQLVSFVVDVSFFLDVGLKPEEWVGRFAPRLAGIHLRDHKAAKEVLLGEGELNPEAVAASLRKAGWSGWVILELNKRTDRTSRQLITEARQYMKQRMGV
ncbi:MAG: sugar phosphate isomerase/epimerase [Acidobacteria bacterium]|nr:sugar phosphate isomerase/epimerase [Acidobacteriota bacterium]